MTDMTPAPISVERLRELLGKATPGPWQVDPIDNEGDYGSGPDPHTGFKSFAICDERGLVIMDSLNSEVAMVEEDFSGDRVYAWDDVALNNANLISAAVNAMPALLQQLAELERDNATMRGTDYHQVGVEQEQEIIDLEAKLADREAEVARLERDRDALGAKLVEECDLRIAAEYDAAKWRALRDMKCCTLTLSLNEGHAVNYMTMADWTEQYPEWYENVPGDELERMKAVNTDWCLQVYPDTPIGFYTLHGATLDSVFAAFLAASGGA